MFWRRSRRFEVVVRSATIRLGVEEVIGRPMYFKHRRFRVQRRGETGTGRCRFAASVVETVVSVMNAPATKQRLKVFMLPEMSFG